MSNKRNSQTAKINFTQGQKQTFTQKFKFSQKQETYLKVLELPILELNGFLMQEISVNPILNWNEEPNNEPEVSENRKSSELKEVQEAEQDFRVLDDLDTNFAKSMYEPDVISKSYKSKEGFYTGHRVAGDGPNLYEVLMTQVRETFESKRLIMIAERFVENIDSQGFLKFDVDELEFAFPINETEKIEVLEKIKKFDPEGVGSKDVRELLTFRLKARNEENSLAFRIVSKSFDDLIHQRYSKISKRFSVSYEEIQECFSLLGKLIYSPGSKFQLSTPDRLKEDATVCVDDEGDLCVKINEIITFPMRLNSKYIEMLYDKDLEEKSKKYLMGKLNEAKTLYQSLEKRKQTLKKTIEIILRVQKGYFLGEKRSLSVLTMQSVAEELELNVSTISRAISNKMISFEGRLLSLRDFFVISSEGGSQDETLKAIEEIIVSEDKSRPLKDDEIAKLLSEKGISCTRRMVSKYRSKLRIGSSLQRKIQK